VFRDDILRKRRIDFYTRLRTAMEKWSGDGETT
jgi:hypothetical protein